MTWFLSEEWHGFDGTDSNIRLTELGACLQGGKEKGLLTGAQWFG